MKTTEKKLLKIFSRLAESERDTLMAFADFLDARDNSTVSEPVNQEPVDIARPKDESVVAAIKRLNATFHMLESRHLLDEATMLMTQHVMQGRDKIVVIDELEILFRRHYDKAIEEPSTGEA